MSCSGAFGLAVRLRCARQGCELLPKSCTYQEPGIELICSLLPKKVPIQLLASLNPRWHVADPGLGMSRLWWIQNTAVLPREPEGCS